MKYLSLSIALIVAAVIAGYVLFNQSREDEKRERPENIQSATSQKWESQKSDVPPVSVTVTPIELGASAEVWTFKVSLDTHTGSLDEDLANVSTLADAKGNEYKAVSWDGAGPGGHHREGILSFEPISPKPETIILKIRNIGGAPEREFSWRTE